MIPRTYRMTRALPFFPGDALYEIDMETGQVFRFGTGPAKYPLRPELAGYLMMLLAEPGVLERVGDD